MKFIIKEQDNLDNICPFSPAKAEASLPLQGVRKVQIQWHWLHWHVAVQRIDSHSLLTKVATRKKVPICCVWKDITEIWPSSQILDKALYILKWKRFLIFVKRALKIWAIQEQKVEKLWQSSCHLVTLRLVIHPTEPYPFH